MKTFPKIITFRITSKCNNNCKYCCGPQKNIGEMNLSELKKLFYLFSNKGVKAIVLTGGEPLLRKDFEEIVKELIKRKIKIFLDTNGDLFFKYPNLILKNINVLGLPIDFPDSSYRSSNNFKTIIKILNFIKSKKQRPLLRIGTVVTKDNFNDLERVGNLLKNYPIDIWKIYEFLPQNINAVKNKSHLEISSKQFDETTQKLKEKFSKHFSVVVSKRKDRTKAYFFVASNGTVFMPVDDFNICKEVKLGNVFDKNIVCKWKQLVAENNYLNNAKATFSYRF